MRDGPDCPHATAMRTVLLVVMLLGCSSAGHTAIDGGVGDAACPRINCSDAGSSEWMFEPDPHTCRCMAWDGPDLSHVTLEASADCVITTGDLGDQVALVKLTPWARTLTQCGYDDEECRCECRCDRLTDPRVDVDSLPECSPMTLAANRAR